MHEITTFEVIDLREGNAGVGYDAVVKCSCGWRGMGWGISPFQARFNASLDHESHVKEQAYLVGLRVAA